MSNIKIKNTCCMEAAEVRRSDRPAPSFSRCAGLRSTYAAHEPQAQEGNDSSYVQSIE
jgi:hypothetical protein